MVETSPPISAAGRGVSFGAVAETYKNFIGGQWVAALSGETFQNLNPADTRDVVGLFSRSGQEDTRKAIDAAREAQPKWAAMPAPKRGEILFKAAQLLEARAEAVAKDMTREEGKTLPEAKAEVGRAINILRYFGGEGSRLCGEAIPSERPRVFIHTVKKPVGVVGLITPWNFPIAIPCWKLAPALISGNAVVLKPSDLSPLCSLRLVEVLDEAGVTKGALNLVTGPGSKVGAELVSNPGVNAISFTGSEQTGSNIAVECAKQRKRVQLEMGGKNPTIVLADADINDAVEVVTNAAFFSTGQKCTATSRVVVEEAILRPFTDALVERVKKMKVGNGMEAGIDMGPSVDESQLKTVLDYVDIAKKEGAKVALGGQRLSEGALAHGFFSSPAVVTDVRPEMRVAQEEIFGPVAAILPARDIDDAVKIANGIRFGLSASICTRNLTSAFEFINRIEAGLVMVNLPSAGVEYQVPFGGSKQSSMGMREQGSVAVDFYTEMKTVYLKY